MPGASNYDETYRPQFHFSPERNWTNDPNGLVFYRGEYHLFFQHNPQGVEWGNMTWGHAVSTDLVHWRQLDHALYGDHLGTCFSGSAVVDAGDTAGLKRGDEETLVALYTAAGGCVTPQVPFTQAMAYSNDRGRSWEKFDGNPIVPHIAAQNRDPKVFWWHSRGGCASNRGGAASAGDHWVMALYLEARDGQERFALLGSADLKSWRMLSEVALPAGECPDMFELPVDGDARNSRWVFWCASGHYLVGSFDGTTFTPQGGPQMAYCGGTGRADAYAAQTFGDIPPADGRRIQMAWFQNKIDGMPFTHFMTFPTVLTLRSTPQGPRLASEPAREIELLHGPRRRWQNVELLPGRDALAGPGGCGLEGELFDLQAELELGQGAKVAFDIRGCRITIDAAARQIVCGQRTAPLPLAGGRVKLRMLIDRASIELFADDGLVCMPLAFIPPGDNRRIALTAETGRARLVSLAAIEMKSIWR